MQVHLGPGEKLEVRFHDEQGRHSIDGAFVVAFTEEAITVDADMPDEQGRVGRIYAERFRRPPRPGEEISAVVPR